MARIGEVGAGQQSLQNHIQGKIGAAKSFEEAAQAYASAIYAEFKESLVLARLFVTVPYGDLPAPNKAAVDALVGGKGLGSSLKTTTPVLSLAGTAGQLPDWNDRRRSRGHVGIPLISSAFIDAIPMMSRLLKQLGLGLEWVDRNDSSIVKSTMGSVSGVFYVRDAGTEVDHLNRKIIAAQDFVKQYGVKTVFGFGGGYLASSTFSVTILFCKDSIEEAQAKQLAQSLAFFKTATVSLVRKAIFS